MLYIPNMLTSDALAAYDGSKIKIAEALQLTRSAVAQWGRIVPKASALRLEQLNPGKLAVDETLYKSNRPIRDVAA